MNLENDIEYKRILEELKHYHLEPIGFTNYISDKTRSDTIYPKQLNTCLGLLIKISQDIRLINAKLINLQNQIEKLSTLGENKKDNNLEKELEDISLSLKSLTLNPESTHKSKQEKPLKRKPFEFGQIRK